MLGSDLMDKQQVRLFVKTYRWMSDACGPDEVWWFQSRCHIQVPLTQRWQLKKEVLQWPSPCMCSFIRKWKCWSLSHVRLFETPWSVAHQAAPSMGSSRPEYWSELPFPSPGDLPSPGIKPGSPSLQADSLLSEPQGSPSFISPSVNYASETVIWSHRFSAPSCTTWWWFEKAFQLPLGMI